jgi:tRNA pseudouridine55 synthase
MTGLINLDKPERISSFSALYRIRRLLPPGVKIGHAGTLDRFASGVLVVLIGKATRQCEQWMGQPKEYVAVIKLGATTETLDPEAPETALPDAPRPGLAEVQAVLPRFMGAIQQLPPRFSALKIKGRRACDRARRGQAVELAPRPVRIDELELLEYTYPRLRVRVTCGRGTYIRSLARDLAGALGTAGYLTWLRRTRVGGLTVEKAVKMEELLQEGIERYLAGG